MGLFVFGRRKLAFGERKQKARASEASRGFFGWVQDLPN
jgi:hypothetical protein